MKALLPALPILVLLLIWNTMPDLTRFSDYPVLFKGFTVFVGAMIFLWFAACLFVKPEPPKNSALSAEILHIQPTSSGGRGGDASTGAGGTAIGGTGGASGPGGRGGDGGGAVSTGPGGFAMGGDGGEAGQADRGGKGAPGPLEKLGYPPEMWRYGAGGDGGSQPMQAPNAKEWPPLSSDQIAVWGKKMTPFSIADFYILYSGSRSELLGQNIRDVADFIKGCTSHIEIKPAQDWGSLSVKKKNGNNDGITIVAPKDYKGAQVLLDLLTSGGYRARINSDWGFTTAVVLFIGNNP